MAAKPVTWVSWADARREMRKICSQWAWDHSHADKAFVNALRLRKVSYNGEARAIELYQPGEMIPLADVVAGLLNVDGLGRAEYERTGWSAAPAFGRLPFHESPRPIVEKAIADVSGAKLAWEEFSEKLTKYELPNGALPNPDPAETLEDQDRRPIVSAVERGSKSKRKQLLAYRARVAEYKKLGRAPPIQKTKGGEQGDREWATENGVSRADITAWRLKMLNPSLGRPRNSAGK